MLIMYVNLFMYCKLNVEKQQFCWLGNLQYYIIYKSVVVKRLKIM